MPTYGYNESEHLALPSMRTPHWQNVPLWLEESVQNSYGVQIFLLFIAYCLTAKLGLSLHAVHTFAALVWPPTGIALAVLLLYGKQLWPAVALGAFVVNLLTGATPLVALGIAVGNTLEAVAGVVLLRNYFHNSLSFSNLREGIEFISTACVITIISASLGVGSLWLGGAFAATAIPSTWLAWWVGDLIGALVVAPFLLTWASDFTFSWTKQQLVELILLFSILIISSFLVFWEPTKEIGPFPTIYVLFIPLVWSVLRTGPRGVTTTILVMSAIAIAATIMGRGPFMYANVQQELFALQAFIGFVSIIFLPFSSIVEERRNSTAVLRENIDKLEEALRRLSNEDQAKTEFIATLAHELRNPLAPVVSSLELLRIELKDARLPKILHFTDVIESHVGTITQLLDDLLDVSRISQKKFKLRLEPVELQSVINHSCQTVEPLYQARSHTLTVSVPKKALWLKADPLRLEQIIVNLLYNAAKYTKPGGLVTIAADVDNKHVIIRVSDNGIGIAENMLTKIFEPFIQARSNTAVGTGLGIGLALTKRLVGLHGGEIRVESAGLDRGSVFTVELPLPTDVQLPMTVFPVGTLKRSVSGKKKRAGRKNVLIVDDNEAAAAGIGALLEHEGHRVVIAHDGATALSRLKEFKADVVLLDIGLPHMNGYEVARKIRADGHKQLMLIAVTGYGQREDKLKAQKAGFNHHLTKPVSITEILRLVTDQTKAFSLSEETAAARETTNV